MFTVIPRRSRASEKVIPRSLRGRWKQDVAHAEQWSRIKNQRLYQLQRTRPHEFSEAEKRELRHRHRYGETRGETYRKLNGPFQEGRLNKGQFKKFRHALGMKENFEDYKAYRKYRGHGRGKGGLQNLTKKEFKKAKKFINFNFGVSEFEAYKKMKKKGLGSLNEQELRTVNRIRGVQISPQTHQQRRKLFLAKRKGLVNERNGRLHISKKLENLDRGEVRLLRELGFNLPRFDRLQDVLEYRAGRRP